MLAEWGLERENEPVADSPAFYRSGEPFLHQNGQIRSFSGSKLAGAKKNRRKTTLFIKT